MPGMPLYSEKSGDDHCPFGSEFVRQVAGKTKRTSSDPKTEPGRSVPERRVATPNPNLQVVKTGDRYREARVQSKEPASRVIARVEKVISKPGADRTRLFRSTSGKPVFAYFVHSNDPTMVVREDEAGQQTIGRFSGGRFRPVTSTATD